jgi:hypothetical protein
MSLPNRLSIAITTNQGRFTTLTRALDTGHTWTMRRALDGVLVDANYSLASDGGHVKLSCSRKRGRSCRVDELATAPAGATA